jgi:hypothetical protein
MDLFDENIIALKSIWDDGKTRQNAKLVIYHAIVRSSAGKLNAQEVDDIFTELDVILLSEESKKPVQADPAR